MLAIGRAVLAASYRPWRPGSRPVSRYARVAAIPAGGGELPPSVAAKAAPEPPCGAIRLAEPARRRSVVLIVSDTMRRDRVGIYGGPASTPVFDSFARSNLYFDRAYSQAPWTKPSLATLFTSLYPSQHGVQSHPEFREQMGRGEDVLLPQLDVLNAELATLTEVMKENGYRTGAIVSNPWMKASLGFEQGFDSYDDSLAGWDAPGVEVSRRGLAWIDGLAEGERFFLYLHYMDSHLPYGVLEDDDVLAAESAMRADRRPVSEDGVTFYDFLLRHPQNELSSRTRELLADIGPSRVLLDMAYDRGIEAFDRALGAFLKGLADRPRGADAAILILSDHGEAMFERGYGNHGHGLFDDEIAVPFAARLPGTTAESPRIECAIGLIDVFPTLCAYLGLRGPETMHGQSVVDVGGPPRRARYIVSEGVMLKSGNRALRNRFYKVFWEPEGGAVGAGRGFSLYEDEEGYNLVASGPDSEPVPLGVLDVLAEELPSAVPAFEAPRVERVPLDAATEERLRALGY